MCKIKMSKHCKITVVFLCVCIIILKDVGTNEEYSAFLVIQTSIIRVLDYPNSLKLVKKIVFPTTLMIFIV